MRKVSNFLGNKVITISTIALVVFGSLMIASAEMGNSVGDTDYLSGVILEQSVFAVVCIIAYFVCMHINLYKRNDNFFKAIYIGILIALLACRVFGQINGAYAWIRFGSMSVQPSEFAKVFMIVFGGKILGNDDGKENLDNLLTFVKYAAIYFVIIAFYQKDLGSAVVLFTICYCILMIPPYREYQKVQRWMRIGIVAAIGFIVFVFSPIFTNFLMKFSDNYMIGRFLAAANPFLYRYDNGYHVIMSLVSFANGGLFGLGYGNSIHKYMNFPNPSNDFILPVIVEELGVIGFIAFVAGYCALLVPLVKASFKSKYISSKIVYLGVFTYFVVHFILNVGGVSAIIPLTGVPLLLISSGGSSLVASMCGLGFAQCELIRNKAINNESNSREV